MVLWKPVIVIHARGCVYANIGEVHADLGCGECNTCSSYRGVLPEVSTALQDAIRGKEDKQTIWHHPCKVDDGVPQVLLVLTAVPVVVATVQWCAFRSNRHHTHPHLPWQQVHVYQRAMNHSEDSTPCQSLPHSCCCSSIGSAAVYAVVPAMVTAAASYVVTLMFTRQ